MQETHATFTQEFRWKITMLARSCGTAILYRPIFQVLNVRRDDSGRLVVVEFFGNNFDFQVMCLYAPNSTDEGRQFFESLYQTVDPDILIVMCGNFNATVDPHIDLFGCNPESPWANNWASTHRELMIMTSP